MAGRTASRRARTKAPSRPRYVSAYAIFEGGGAKGIAHVGALRAMDKAGLALAGVAGTSAGAIFAALVAVGYTADEIFRDEKQNILATLDVGGPVNLIGSEKWRELMAVPFKGICLLMGIATSTFLSTVLAASVLGDALGSQRGLMVLFVAVVGASLLVARLAHLATMRLQFVPALVIALLCGSAAAALGLTGKVPLWLAAAVAGFSLGLPVSAALKRAPILLAAGGAIALLIAGVLQWGEKLPLWLISAALFAIMAWSAWIALTFARQLLLHLGMVDGAVVRDVINTALRAKLAEVWQEEDGEIPDVVLFRHIAPGPKNKFIPLKVVTTNIDLGQLTIIDGSRPDVPVAEAVAASAALPLVFRPATITGMDDARHRYADGGLVSNLPSWVFRDEKRHRERFEAFDAGQFRRIPVYAIALKEPEEKLLPVQPEGIERIMRVRSALRYFIRLVSTAIFGGQSVVQNFIPDLKSLEITATLGTLDLDCTGLQAKHQIEDAERQTLEILRRERKRDLLATAILEEIHREIQPEIARVLGKSRIRDLRVVLLDPVHRTDTRTPLALRVRHIFGGDDETNTDDELELDLEGGIAAKAFREGDLVSGEIGSIGAGPLWMTKYEHALLPRALRSAIAIPVSGANGTARVLTVDSRDDLQPLKDDKTFKDMLVSLCVPLAPEFFDKTVEVMSYDT